MTLTGFLMMLISWISILSLCVFTLRRIIRADQKHIHAPLEIEDEDLGTGDKG